MGPIFYGDRYPSSEALHLFATAGGGGPSQGQAYPGDGLYGAPADWPIVEVGCLRDQRQIPSGVQHEMCRGIHAEQNAIIQAALHGVSTQGGTIYCTHQPCILCAKMIINAGIRRVVFAGDYPDELSRQLLTEAEVELVQLSQD